MAVLFVVGAVILLRQKQASSDEFVAKFGDLTQIVTANLAGLTIASLV